MKLHRAITLLVITTIGLTLGCNTGCNDEGLSELDRSLLQCLNSEPYEPSPLPRPWNGCGANDQELRDQGEGQYASPDDPLYCIDYNFESGDGCDETCTFSQIRTILTACELNYSSLYFHSSSSSHTLRFWNSYADPNTHEARQYIRDESLEPGPYNGGSILRFSMPCHQNVLIQPFANRNTTQQNAEAQQNEIGENLYENRDVTISYKKGGPYRSDTVDIPGINNEILRLNPLVHPLSPLCKNVDGKNQTVVEIPITDSYEHALFLKREQNSPFHELALRIQLINFIPLEPEDENRPELGYRGHIDQASFYTDGDASFEIPTGSHVFIRQLDRQPLFNVRCEDGIPGGTQRVWSANYTYLEPDPDGGEPIERTASVSQPCEISLDIPELELGQNTVILKVTAETVQGPAMSNFSIDISSAIPPVD